MLQAPQKRSLLITLDAFGTLYNPKPSIAKQYLQGAKKHGIDISATNVEAFQLCFKEAFKKESAANPNYGKENGLNPFQWWTNVTAFFLSAYGPTRPKSDISVSLQIIHDTFKHALPNETLPVAFPPDLISHFSSRRGMPVYSDAHQFLRQLQSLKTSNRMVRISKSQYLSSSSWPFDQIIVGVISNSDDRVKTILRSNNVSVESFTKPSAPDRTSGIGLYSRRDTIENKDAGPPMIDFITLSYDTGHEKPSPWIFANAFAKAVSMSPTAQLANGDWTKVHIGDHEIEDAWAAANCGWNAILLERPLLGMVRGKNSVVDVFASDVHHKVIRGKAVETVMDLENYAFNAVIRICYPDQFSKRKSMEY